MDRTHRKRDLEPAALYQVLRELLGLLRAYQLDLASRTLNLLLGIFLSFLLLDGLVEVAFSSRTLSSEKSSRQRTMSALQRESARRSGLAAVTSLGN